MKWKPYPAYKDSGIEWLGKIPTNWETKRLKRLFRVVNGSTPKSGESDYWDGDIPWVTPDDLGELVVPELSRPTRYITRKGYESCGTTLVPEGSLVLSTRAPIGHLAIAGVPLCTNQGCRSLVFSRRQSERYYYYQVLAARRELESLGDGSTFKELAKESLESVLLLEPPPDEQRAIAAFLDRETAKIDALVAKKERLIELLQEKRAALITHAVTKGLDPTVPMKDSGVEWLGRIPAHWEIKRNKVLFREIDHRSLEGEEELLTVSHITGVTKRSEKEVYMIEAESHEGYKLCERDDLAINTMWAWMGALGIAGEPGMVSPSYNIYRLKDRALLPRYYDYLCRIPAHVSELTRFSKGVWKSRLRLYPEEFFEIITPVPKPKEQQAIAEMLDRETAKLDALIAKVREGIEKLKEYRTALISVAVTGKIDVREEAA
ncbi:MAG TPA: restriction endonuclease subunit S [Nitrospiraceae bacterium]|jgi:type I restriction enzyme S subunit|nr:restriction endonuclease subunit S [Nitrospiraceae bacterium]